jgi:glutaredoxin-related protein
MLKRRHVNVKTVKELDAFPKVPELYIDKTAVGGTCKSRNVNKMRLSLYINNLYIMNI